jgi:hypothetical protein
MAFGNTEVASLQVAEAGDLFGNCGEQGRIGWAERFMYSPTSLTLAPHERKKRPFAFIALPEK